LTPPFLKINLVRNKNTLIFAQIKTIYMLIAILILVYVLWLGDFIEVCQNKKSNYLISSTLTILLSWQVDTAWGIVMLCVFSLIFLIHLLRK
jgi:uncharacterized membrane protein